MKPTYVLLVFILIIGSIALFFNLQTFSTIRSENNHHLERNTIKNVQQTSPPVSSGTESDLEKNPKKKSTPSSETEKKKTYQKSIIFNIEDAKKENFKKISFGTCFANSSHYSIKPSILKASMKEEMYFKTNKINKSKRKFPAKHTSVEFIEEECLQEEGGTPECSMWNCFSDATKLNSDEHEEPSIALKKCCHEHKALKETALWVIQKLEEHEIRYFLSTGSALGAIRHNGVIIPWDTDVDMAIFPEDAERVKQIFTSFKHEHYFHADPNGKPMYWIHHSKNGKPVGGPHVEIFFEADYTKHKQELLPLQRCDFYGKNNAWCPKVDMFEIWFGKNWRCYGGGHYHNDGRCTIYHLGKRIEKANCKGGNDGGNGDNKEDECNPE